ncbi:hypothetical protein FS749_016382 [Ceratobasidium sp. UAMH 11750]|nr:hypothetical protein FS749_016382 [Ceratobasidium sp. UAMH 11750]
MIFSRCISALSAAALVSGAALKEQLLTDQEVVSQVALEIRWTKAVYASRWTCERETGWVKPTNLKFDKWFPKLEAGIRDWALGFRSEFWNSEKLGEWESSSCSQVVPLYKVDVPWDNPETEEGVRSPYRLVFKTTGYTKGDKSIIATFCGVMAHPNKDTDKFELCEKY